MAGRKPDGYAVLFQVRGPSPAADRLAVSHALMAAGDAQAARAFAAWPIAATLPSGMLLRRNPTPRPRLEWVDQPILVTTSQQAVQQLAQGQLGERTAISGAVAAATPGSGEVRLVADAPSEVQLQSRSAAAGWVVLRDAWAPGWQVEVDGQPAAAQIADGLLRAVAVPAGDHRVTWRYIPQTWPWTPLVSLLAWLGLAALLWPWRRGDLPQIQAVDKAT